MQIIKKFLGLTVLGLTMLFAIFPYCEAKLTNKEIKTFNEQRHSKQFRTWVKTLASLKKVNNVLLDKNVDNKLNNKNTEYVIKTAVLIFNFLEQYNKNRQLVSIYHFDNGHYMCSPTGMLQMINILYNNGATAEGDLKSFLEHIKKNEKRKPGNEQHYVTMADQLNSWYKNLSKDKQINIDSLKHFTGVHERCCYMTDINHIMKIFPGQLKEDFTYKVKQSLFKYKNKLALDSKLTKDNILNIKKAISSKNIITLPKIFFAKVDQTINSHTILKNNSEYSLDNLQFLITLHKNKVIIYELKSIKITAIDPSRKYAEGPRKGQTLDDHHVRMILKLNDKVFAYADPKLNNYFERASIKEAITDPEAKPSGNPDLNYNSKFNVITNVAYQMIYCE